mgnify:CR=1 FL=1
MVIDKDSLQALNIAINDWDDNNRSSEDYEENRLRLEEIYSVIHQQSQHIKNPEHTLIYSYDMVCEDCGSNEWHCNLHYNNRNHKWFYGEIDSMGQETGEDVWCHECQSWRDLVAADEYEKEGE